MSTPTISKLIDRTQPIAVIANQLVDAAREEAQVIHLAHAAGWSKYRIAQRLAVTRSAVDEALERPVPLTPEQFLDLEVKRNGGLENPDVRGIRELLRRGADS